MSKILLSRQPIYDRRMAEFGYELCYRNNDDDRAKFFDGDQATAEVIINTLEIGLQKVVGQYLAFINFDRNLLVDTHCESLPRHRVVLELVETPTPDENLLKELKRLRASGFQIAVSGAVHRDWVDALLAEAEFVKIRIDTEDWGMIERSVTDARKHKVRLIAEKVETRRQFQHCLSLGFEFFQGYYFCKPEIVGGNPTAVNRLSTLCLIATLNDPRSQIDEVERAISRDVRLSYKLLLYANSALCGLRRPLDSIRHAVVLVGLERIRSWTTLLLLYGLEDDGHEIFIRGAVRAKMCEQLAILRGFEKPERLFLVGLLSVLEAIVNQPLAIALAPLPIEPMIKDAILYQKGDLGAVLKCVLAYEKQDWIRAGSGLNLPFESIRDSYIDALKWAVQVLSELSSESSAAFHPELQSVDNI